MTRHNKRQLPEKISEIEKGRNFKIKNQDQVGSSLVSKNEGCAMDFGLSFGLMCWSCFGSSKEKGQYKSW